MLPCNPETNHSPRITQSPTHILPYRLLSFCVLILTFQSMLLSRFPVAVKPNQSAKKAQTIDILVSYYRQSVDPVYQSTINKKIDSGLYDRYVAMMLHLLLDTGKKPSHPISFNSFELSLFDHPINFLNCR